MTTQKQNPAYRLASRAPTTGSPDGPTDGATPPLARRIFALADTHLGTGIGRTMDKFGPWWKDHTKKIQQNAQRLIGPDDIFLLPGDLSWAKKRNQAESDLAYLAALPGIKVAIKGNHDFWWESDKPIAYPGLHSPPFITSNGAIGIAGSRGWDLPVKGSANEAIDRGFFEREQKRLEKSLAAIQDCTLKIAMLHYPPQPFLPILKAAGVHIAVYGHVHINSLPKDERLALDGERVEGILLYCVACDRIGFTPRLLWSGDDIPTLLALEKTAEP